MTNSSEKIIDTFLDNLSEMGLQNSYGGEQIKSFEPFVDGVHSPLGEEPIRNVDHMGTIGQDIFLL